MNKQTIGEIKPREYSDFTFLFIILFWLLIDIEKKDPSMNSKFLKYYENLHQISIEKLKKEYNLISIDFSVSYYGQIRRYTLILNSYNQKMIFIFEFFRFKISLHIKWKRLFTLIFAAADLWCGRSEKKRRLNFFYTLWRHKVSSLSLNIECLQVLFFVLMIYIFGLFSISSIE